jgi:hypothetical protein
MENIVFSQKVRSINFGATRIKYFQIGIRNCVRIGCLSKSVVKSAESQILFISLILWFMKPSSCHHMLLLSPTWTSHFIFLN